ncbi:MAG: hypothetical protein ABI999_05945 [Acidobacteriota bacterium]
MSRLRINKIGVLSSAKIQGATCVVLGLIIGVIYGAFIILYSLIGASLVGGDAKMAVGGGGVVVGVVTMIACPIIYGIMGFIFGALGAFLYNVFAKMIGGIEMEVENI